MTREDRILHRLGDHQWRKEWTRQVLRWRTEPGPDDAKGDGRRGWERHESRAALRRRILRLLENALRRIADRQNKDLGDYASITADVDIGQPVNGGGFGLGVELIGHLPNLPRDEAQALMEEAHQRSPYSRATSRNIDVKLTVEE
jgi:hypothetical protein